MLQSSNTVSEMKDDIFMGSLEDDEAQDGIYILKVIKKRLLKME